LFVDLPSLKLRVVLSSSARTWNCHPSGPFAKNQSCHPERRPDPRLRGEGKSRDLGSCLHYQHIPAI